MAKLAARGDLTASAGYFPGAIKPVIATDNPGSDGLEITILRSARVGYRRTERSSACTYGSAVQRRAGRRRSNDRRAGHCCAVSGGRTMPTLLHVRARATLLNALPFQSRSSDSSPLQRIHALQDSRVLGDAPGAGQGDQTSITGPSNGASSRLPRTEAETSQVHLQIVSRTG